MSPITTTAARALLLRQSRLSARAAGRRMASSTTTEQATANAQAAGKKAQDGLSQALAKAGPVFESAVQSLRKLGGPAGKVVSAVEKAIPPTVYYSKVAFAVSKTVVKQRGMAPPSLATFQSYYNPLIRALQSPSSIPSCLAKTAESLKYDTVRAKLSGMSCAQWAGVGIVAAEVIGFFSVGEMIGRRKIVGYHGEVEHAEH